MRSSPALAKVQSMKANQVLPSPRDVASVSEVMSLGGSTGLLNQISRQPHVKDSG